MNKNRFRIGKAFISVTNPQDAIEKIEFAVKNKLSAYICVSNLRMVKYANSAANKSYLELMNCSYMNLPDGMPLVWCGKLWGIKNIQCTTGPELFDTMLKCSENGIKHFLLGDTEETLNAIVEKYGNQQCTNIVGTFSPPFADVKDFDYVGILKIIKESGADIIWISLRAPKQDIFSKHISSLLKTTVCIGVGRAFRISIGVVKQAPKSVQKFGISGLFNRRVSLGKELLWYFKNSFYLLYVFIQILFSRFVSKKHYE